MKETNFRILYTDSSKRRRHLDGDGIHLTSNTWDDYSYKTLFGVTCKIKGETIDLGAIRILFSHEKASYEYLDKLIRKGWDGHFPVPNADYVSVPSALEFYAQLMARLGPETTKKIAEVLRDASYLTRIKEDEKAIALTNSQGFQHSLLRESASVRAFSDGWKVLSDAAITIGNLLFQFISTKNHALTLNLKFASDNPLPHDINVLIGPNGVGKSQILHQIVKYWLSIGNPEENVGGFTERPNLSQLVVVSYSPFELFPVDSEDVNESDERHDQEVYKYFGLRGRQKQLNNSRRGSKSVSLNRNFPKAKAADSLLNCLADDQKYGAIKDWANKIQTMEKVLRNAFDFDEAAIVVDPDASVGDYFTDEAYSEDFVLTKSYDDEGDPSEKLLVRVSSDWIDVLKISALKKHAIPTEGVIFLKDGEPVLLSSGQRLFSYIVINILGAIRRNSLIIIDEPELFLHPALEIAFVRMLKEILRRYSAKALIATHSLVTVREIPSDCVHVLEETKDGIVIKTPPFETFGGDIQRISSYVFGDKSISKPYEEWLEAQFRAYGSADGLIKALGKNINEELLIQIRGMDDN